MGETTWPWTLRWLATCALITWISVVAGARLSPGEVLGPNPAGPAVPPPSAPAYDYRTWTQEREGLRRQLFDAAFLDARHGWAVGGDGTMLRTTDGGTTWTRQEITAPDLGRIAFVSDHEGWVVGEFGHILFTQTMGASWEVRPRPAREDLLGIRFVKPGVGWIVGDRGLILKTENGGQRWRRQRSGVPQALRDVACFSAQECAVIGAAATVLTTANGGGTWTKRITPVGPSDLKWMSRAVIGRDGSLWATGGGTREGYLLRSTDRGKRWTLASDFPNPIGPLHFWDGKRGVVFAGEILLTADGGGTWTVGQNPAPGILLQAIVFVNDNLGWAVGDFRTILHTQDRGKTWILQHQELPGPRR